MNWADAKKACPKGYRLPSRGEFVSLLDGCKKDVLDGGYGECNSCAESKACRTMFSSDTGWYWSSSAGGAGLAWVVKFYSGSVNSLYVDRDRNVRCVRSGP